MLGGQSRTGCGDPEVAAGFNVGLDATGNVVGIDIDHASRKLDLSTLETVALPPTSTRAA
jgi:hypothetical protein